MHIQAICIRFCLNLKKDAQKLFANDAKSLSRHESMGKTQIKERFNRFKNYGKFVVSNLCSGRYFYVRVLKRRDAVRRKWLHFSGERSLTHHDNAPAHSLKLTLTFFFAKHEVIYDFPNLRIDPRLKLAMFWRHRDDSIECDDDIDSHSKKWLAELFQRLKACIRIGFGSKNKNKALRS